MACAAKPRIVGSARLRIIARLFTGPAVATAVKAFDKYEENLGDDPDEFYTRVPVETLRLVDDLAVLIEAEQGQSVEDRGDGFRR